jgi:hypothetical protein
MASVIVGVLQDSTMGERGVALRPSAVARLSKAGGA